jgi:hypothetical protein
MKKYSFVLFLTLLTSFTFSQTIKQTYYFDDYRIIK